MANLQTPDIFLDDFCKAIENATDNILIQSMLFESGAILDKIIASLKIASGKGIKIKIIYDWVSSKYIHSELPLFVPPFSKQAKLIQEMQSRNKQAIKIISSFPNTELQMVNKPNVIMSLTPFVGRNHMKIYVVDNKIWIGGINISDESFMKNDFVVKFENEELLREVKQIFENNFKRIKYSDYKRQILDDTLFVDAGKKRQSIIYDRAVELIKTAENKIIFTSQFVPDGKILDDIVKKSKENIEIEIITTNFENKIFHALPENLAFKKFLKKIANNKNIIFKHAKKSLHAKLIIIDEKEAMFGSHNFVTTGVNFGTQELAIDTQDTSLIKDLIAFARKIDI